MNKVIFTISTTDENDIERAAERLAHVYCGHSSYDNVIIENLEDNEAVEIVDEIFRASAKGGYGSHDPADPFALFGIVVSGVRIDRTESAKKELLQKREEDKKLKKLVAKIKAKRSEV